MRERDREEVHCKCTMQYTVHFIIPLFNAGNVLLCVIYQLNFTVFMSVTLISRYIKDDSGGLCNTLVSNSMCGSKQKSSYELGSDFERLPRLW
jgi:hypothetical protein